MKLLYCSCSNLFFKNQTTILVSVNWHSFANHFSWRLFKMGNPCVTRWRDYFSKFGHLPQWQLALPIVKNICQCWFKIFPNTKQLLNFTKLAKFYWNMVTLNTSLFCLHLFISNDLGKKKKCLAEFELISLEKKERRATLYPPHGHHRVRSFIIIFFILFETCSNLFTLFTQAETGSFWYQLVQFCNRIEPFVLLL